jgi:CDP-diglyceride synthetase
MAQLQSLLSALGTDGQHGPLHGPWWMLLALVVLVAVMPLAWFFGKRGGGPDRA